MVLFRFSYITTTADKRREILSAGAEIPGREEMKIFSTTFNTGSVGTELLDELGKLRRMLHIRPNFPNSMHILI